MKYAHAARAYIIEIALLGTVVAALVIAQAFLISGAASPVITDGATLADTLPAIGALAIVVSLRALITYLRESRAHRAADQTVAELRAAVAAKAAALGPRWRSANGADAVTLITRGLDDLNPYFVRFLPQLIMVATVTPAALATILYLDFWSALIAALTIPLIPIFMILVGRLTEAASRNKLVAMERLSSQLLDLLTGLPTLRALGRERAPREHLARLSKQNTRTTMATLRIAFLSGAVLEFLTTLSVALVAVSVGFRMVAGDIPLSTGLVVIMLAPEVFEPLRQVGAQFHASANGVAAANASFEVLEEPEPATGSEPAPDLRQTVIRFVDLSVAARGAWAPAGLTAAIQPGTIVALRGPSGAGKTTATQVLLGLEAPTRGTVVFEPVERDARGPEGTAPDAQQGSASGAQQSLSVGQISPASLWEQTTWVPQSPTIFAGSVRANLSESASAEEIAHATAQTGFDQVLHSLPAGLDTELGTGGVGLSVGQRQRLALTRALLRPSPLLILDEPTAHLDTISEEQVVQVLRTIRARGTTVLLTAHRLAVLEIADQIVDVEARRATPDEEAAWPVLTEGQQLPELVDTDRILLDPSYLEPAELETSS